MSAAAENAVQKELQDYLAEKGVNSLFVKIVEHLLMEKPENPISFMVEYLLENYPEETKEFGKLKSQTSKKESIGSAGSEQVEAKEVEYFEETDDDDDEDDYVDELPQVSRQQRPTGRRVSVSAGVLDMNSEVKEVKFDKSDQERETLTKIMSESVLCSHLDEVDMTRIVDAFEKIHVENDKEIISQGDLEAEHYYVLGKGSAAVYKDGNKLDLVYGSGDGFGELALMYNAPRAATIKALEDCELWRLDQVTFKVIVMGSAIKKRERYTAFLEKVPILSEMAPNERLVLADALRPRAFEKEMVIVNEGDDGDEFYIIESGTVRVEKGGKAISNLKEGDYFGEIALLTSKKRQATVVAESDTVKVLTVHRKVFQRVLGPLSDILSRNMEAYSNYLIA